MAISSDVFDLTTSNANAWKSCQGGWCKVEPWCEYKQSNFWSSKLNFTWLIENRPF